ncbi:MAG: 2-oxo acid dehydrogenase subunit E2, partial [Candidatus Puniceispirillaceae bacterium]
MRKIIAQRLQESKANAPHFYLTVDCEIDTLLAARKVMNEQSPDDVKISVNDLVIRAAAMALVKVPKANASWEGDNTRLFHHADIAMAVAVDGGLVTPVIWAAEQKGLAEIAATSRDLATRARNSTLAPEEFAGGSFTISNLGMFGIREFAAVINPPQGAILAVGAGEERPVVRNGELAVATVMTVTLSADHRVVDGAVGAEWLQAFKGYMVIGGGPGGYVAAIRAAQLKMKVALVEREHLGGICLNWGCIPTKALLRAAELRHSIDEMKDFGITVSGEVSIDLKAVVKRSRNVAGRLSTGVAHLLKKNKVTVFDDRAVLGKAVSGRREVKLAGGGVLSAKHVILATGARARALPGIEADDSSILTYREAMVPETMPKSLVIIGSGAIGSEFASFYLDMGVDVTLIEAMDRILPVEDAEISEFVKKAFIKRGMKIITGAR